MADTKIRGVTIELGADTTGISKGLKDVNSEIKSTQSQLKDVEKLLKLDPTNVELLRQKQELLSRAVSESNQKLSVLNEVEKKLKDNGVDENSEQFMALKREIEATSGQMKSMEENTNDGKKTLKEEGKQAEDTGKAHEALKGALEAVGGAFAGMAAAAGAAVVALGKSLVQATVDGAAYADEVKTEATKAGITTEKYQELAYAADLVDVSVETITSAMRKNIKAMSSSNDINAEAVVDAEKLAEAQTKMSESLEAVSIAQLEATAKEKAYEKALAQYGPESASAASALVAMEKAQNNVTKAQNAYIDAQNAFNKAQEPVAPTANTTAAAYEKLGVAVYNSDGSLRDSETVFWEVVNALGEVEDYTEREATAMTILGKSSAELEPLIQAGAERMQEFADAAHDSGYVLGDDTLNAYVDFQDELDKLKTGATAAKNAIGTALLPALTNLGGTGVDLLAKFTNALNGSDGTVGGMIGAIEEILPDIMSTIEEYVPELLQLIVSIVTQILDSLTRMLPSFVGIAGDLISTFVQGIVQALPAIITATMTLVSTIVEVIVDNLPSLIEAAGTMLMTIAEGLIQALPTMIPKIAEVITSIALMLSDENNIEKFIDVAIALIDALAEGLVNAIPILIEASPKIIVGLITGLVKQFPKILEAGKNIILKLWDGIKNCFTSMNEWGEKIWDPIQNSFKEVWPKVKEIGKNIIEGMWEGIKSAWSWVSEGVSGIFNSLVDGVKGVLGIHSPSKVFASIGEYVAEGFGIGWDKEFDKVQDDVLNGVGSLTAPSIVAQGSTQSVSVDASSIAEALNGRSSNTVVTVNFEGSLAQLAQILTPRINTENRRLGVSLAD